MQQSCLNLPNVFGLLTLNLLAFTTPLWHARRTAKKEETDVLCDRYPIHPHTIPLPLIRNAGRLGWPDPAPLAACHGAPDATLTLRLAAQVPSSRRYMHIHTYAAACRKIKCKFWLWDWSETDTDGKDSPRPLGTTKRKVSIEQWSALLINLLINHHNLC